MRTYLFAIGGSGARVLRSLTMLLAAGVDSATEFVPIIIDPDSTNGDLQRTVTEMNLYRAIRKSLAYDDTKKTQFFSTSVTSLSGDGNYLLPVSGAAGVTFDSFINVGGLDPANEALVRMLFSNDNLSGQMDVGFKGNPNIGSVVLNQITDTAEYKTFETNVTAGDRVFIISSIFGGTGASGFPLLLKHLRGSSTNALQTAMVGAVTLLPYFALAKDDKSKIESESFVAKMKAALNYYEENVTGNNTLDHMYYLGDTLGGTPYTNCDGGGRQKNDAHLIELLAALAIIDFCKQPDINRTGNNNSTTFHEFALNTNTQQGVLFTDLGSDTKERIMRPLTQMAIMNSYLTNRDLAHRKDQKWAICRQAKLGENFFKSEFFQNYWTFVVGKNDASGFAAWLRQLQANTKSFAPFANDKDLRTTDGLKKVVGYEPSYPLSLPLFKRGYDHIDTQLSKNIRHIATNLSAEQTFMELFFTTTKQICEKNLNIQ